MPDVMATYLMDTCVLIDIIKRRFYVNVILDIHVHVPHTPTHFVVNNSSNFV